MALVRDPRGPTTPCAQHPADSQVRQHCPGGGACTLGVWSVEIERCHVAGICRVCDHQWIERCDEHTEAAA